VFFIKVLRKLFIWFAIQATLFPSVQGYVLRKNTNKYAVNSPGLMRWSFIIIIIITGILL